MQLWPAGIPYPTGPDFGDQSLLSSKQYLDATGNLDRRLTLPNGNRRRGPRGPVVLHDGLCLLGQLLLLLPCETEDYPQDQGRAGRRGLTRQYWQHFQEQINSSSPKRPALGHSLKFREMFRGQSSQFLVMCSYGYDECLEAFFRNRQAVFFKRNYVTFNGLFDIGNGFLLRFSLTDTTG